MYGKGILKGMGITVKHWFGKNIVVQYPEVQPHLEDRYRGCLQMEFKKCIACESCVRACPNDVLKLETVKDPETKKKKLMTYTINVEYCMFCGLCTEACPVDCLSFNHNFELSQYNREDIKIVYHRPPEMDLPKDEEAAEAEKRQKKAAALTTALTKNPEKGLIKVLEDEEQRKIMAELIIKDASKAEKLAALMVDDMEKAKKVAAAFVAKELKNRQKAAQDAAGAGEKEGGSEA